MFEPALVALTSTPSIAVSSTELTRPLRATAGACAADGNATAKARDMQIEIDNANARRRMVPPKLFFCFGQHRLATRAQQRPLRSASSNPSREILQRRRVGKGALAPCPPSI